MGKRIDTGNAMDSLLKGGRKDTEPSPGAPEKPTSSTMEMCHLRFPPADLRKMQAFAQANSISLSSAIRLAVSEFMQRRGLK